MIEVDGSNGGGQLLRTALSLSAVTGTSVRIEGIRGGRPEPGLKRQHLAAVEAVASACGATVGGDDPGSERLTFEPDEVRGGSYAVDVGTAGSVTLVADALLPLAAVLDDHLAVRIDGGTDVAWSPPLDAHRLAKLPLLRRHGWGVTLECHDRGFYPEGGGAVTVHLFPSDPEPLRLGGGRNDGGGEVERVAVHSVATDDLASSDVAERQADAAVERLNAAGWDVDATHAGSVASQSAGSVVVALALTEHSALVGDALGEPGRPAEDVGGAAAADLVDALAGSAAVDEHLADQLLLPVVLCGGALSIPARTEHVETSLRLLRSWGFDVDVTSDGAPRITADGADAP